MKERAMNSRFQQLLTKYGTILALVIVTLMFSLRSRFCEQPKPVEHPAASGFARCYC